MQKTQINSLLLKPVIARETPSCKISVIARETPPYKISVISRETPPCKISVISRETSFLQNICHCERAKRVWQSVVFSSKQLDYHLLTYRNDTKLNNFDRIRLGISKIRIFTSHLSS